MSVLPASFVLRREIVLFRQRPIAQAAKECSTENVAVQIKK